MYHTTVEDMCGEQLTASAILSQKYPNEVIGHSTAAGPLKFKTLCHRSLNVI